MSQSVDFNLISRKTNLANSVDKIFAVHLDVLKKLVEGKTFEEIKFKYTEKFKRLDYIQIAIKSSLLSFNEKNELIGAYPISPFKTKYMVDIEGVGRDYSMCAIDALGVAYTFNAKTKIITQDHKTGERIEINVNPETGFSFAQDIEPPFVSYGLNTRNGKSSAEYLCPTINFYSSRENIPKSDSISIFEFEEAFESGKKLFQQDTLKKCITNGINNEIACDC
ncbi:MAG: Alkylmercury lyase [Candidatus Heimdallarchaeota archaeon LC_3]|nr:MAG: Alkylmercury lyase [Candidatus Heimdallarchaeota archaeon LC_3]